MKPTTITLGCLLAWAGLATTVRSAVTIVGPATSFSVLTNAANGNRYFELALGTNGTAEVVPFAPDVIRVRYHFAGLYEREEPAIAKPFSNWPAFAMSFTNQSGTNLVLDTGQLRVEIVLSNRFQVHFRDGSGFDVLRDLQIEYDSAYHQISDTNAYAQIAWPSGSVSVTNAPSAFKVKAIKIMPADEVYFGGGEFATSLNRRGASLQYWNQGVFAWEESRNPMYMSLPFYYGVRPASNDRPAFAYGVFFNNPARPYIKFNSGFGDTYSFEAGDDQLDYFFFGGGATHAPATILDRYSELTGRPAFLPRWAYGYHQSRHSYDTQQDLLDVAAGLRENDVPCDALYLDINTQDDNRQLTFNAAYTNVPSLIAAVSNLGMRLVPLVEPFLTTNDPMYAEALTNLYFLKRNDLSTHLHTNFLNKGLSWLDFSIAETRSWWTGRLTNYLAQFPFEGLWNDLNEPEENDMPLNVLYYLDGRYGGGFVTGDTRKWHAVNKSTYALLQTAVTFQSLRTSRPNRRPFVLSRSGWPGIARYAVGWSGDNVASYDHLRHNLRLGTSVMISGQPNFGHDVGGFLWTTNLPAELFTRWLAACSLHPYFRNHVFDQPREPWRFDEESAAINRRIIRFRYALLPYLYTLAADCATNGLPLNRPTFFEFLSDTNTHHLNDYDFLVGRDLLAAPAYASNAPTRSVYLPFGANWFSWRYDTFHFGGQTLAEPAPPGALPLFVREGTILPMGPPIRSADEPAPWIEFHVWPQAGGDFTLYEDDGNSTNYLAGMWAKTRVTSGYAGNTFQIGVGARQGAYSPEPRSFYFVAHALSNVVDVTDNGRALARRANRAELDGAAEGWCYNFPRRLLTVKVSDDAAAHALSADLGAPSPPPTSSFTSIFAQVSVSGTFNAWDDAARNLRRVTNFLWVGVLDVGVITNAHFRYVGNDAASVTNWGDSAQTNAVLPLFNPATPLGSNIFISGVVTGPLTFTFTETNRRYTVRSAAGADSDGDGLDDAWEVYFGLDPLDPADAARDADGDGLSNAQEFAPGTRPVTTDTDGDGQSDFAEWIAGTVPTNGSSYFAVSHHERSATGLAALVRWQAVTGRLYRVEYNENLSGSVWQGLDGFSNLSGAGLFTVTDTNESAQRAYRIKVQPAE